MAVPSATEIRNFLEGYNITSSILSDSWIEARRDNLVIPLIKEWTKMSFDGEKEVSEYLSGNNRPIIMLSNPNAKEIVSIAYVTGGDIDSSIGVAGVRLLDGGIIKAVNNIQEGGASTLFRKGSRNIKVTYTVGETDYPTLVKEAIVYLCSEQILGFVGAKTGGGSISVEGFGRTFGTRGKYQDLRNDLKRQAMSIIRTYMTSVVGSI